MQLLTELESINAMLSMIGASPVSALSGATSADVAISQAIHSEVSRDVQAGGWHFNREYEVELAPNADKYIYLAPNVLQVDVEPASPASGSMSACEHGRKQDKQSKWGKRQSLRLGALLDTTSHGFSILSRP